MKLTPPRPKDSPTPPRPDAKAGAANSIETSKPTKASEPEESAEPMAASGWLIQCPPGLAQVMKREMVFTQATHRDQQVFVKRQRNHDLIFLNKAKDPEGMDRLRVAEQVLRCPVYGRFKISKRQLGIIAEEMKALGPRRLVVTIAGRKFERHDLARFLWREMAERGYEFDDEVEEEAWMFCIDEAWYFGIPLKKGRETQGRDGRTSERRGSLPPPIAAAMAFAGLVKNDDVVMDPTCGSGTLIAECHAYAPEARYRAFDVDPEAIEIAKSNLRSVANLELKKADSRKTGIQGAGITLTIANLPFGVQFGDKASNPELYSALLREQLRLRDPDRPWRGVFLTSDTDSMRAALAEFPELQHEELFLVKARGETATAYRVKFKKH